MMATGAAIYKNDYEDGRQRDIYNTTNNLKVYEEVNLTSHIKIEDYNKSLDVTEYNYQRATNGIFMFMDFMLYSIMELIKFSLEFGYTHASQYDYWNILDVIKTIAIVFGIIFFIPIIIPVIALFYLFFIGIVELIKFLKNKRKTK